MQMPKEEFREKELYQTVQSTVEKRLNATVQYVHPFCLSLDSIGNALNAFISLGCIARRLGSNGRAGTQYTIDRDKMKQLFEQLNGYCSVLRQFNALSNYLLLAKL